jgi:hypothetical protein
MASGLPQEIKLPLVRILAIKLQSPTPPARIESQSELFRRSRLSVFLTGLIGGPMSQKKNDPENLGRFSGSLPSHFG